MRCDDGRLFFLDTLLAGFIIFSIVWVVTFTSVDFVLEKRDTHKGVENDNFNIENINVKGGMMEQEKRILLVQDENKADQLLQSGEWYYDGYSRSRDSFILVRRKK